MPSDEDEKEHFIVLSPAAGVESPSPFDVDGDFGSGKGDAGWKDLIFVESRPSWWPQVDESIRSSPPCLRPWAVQLRLHHP